MRTESLFLDGIELGDRLRSVIPERVQAIVSSIQEIGLQTPITVIEVEGDSDRVRLVAGAHRLEAMRQLGEDMINCVVFPADQEIKSRLWEIAENLHRSELTVQERADHIAEWVKLTGEGIGATCANSSKPGPKGAIRAAVRELGIDRSEAQRAVKIASLSEQAKATAREVGLDDNQSALLSAAKAENPEAELRRLRAEKDSVETARRNREANGQYARACEDNLGRWILAKADVNQLPEIISWLDAEAFKSTNVGAYLKREAA